MDNFSDKYPPPFDRNVDDYKSWRRDFALWQSITETDKKKQGVLLTLRLDKITRDEVYEEVSNDDIITEQGIQKVLCQLDIIFKQDEKFTAFKCYESFENYQRPSTVSITDYCKEFQRKLKTVEDDGTKIADHILAYKLIKSAQLNENQTQLLKATIKEISYKDVMKQLQKIFKSDYEIGYQKECSEEKVTIKVEPLEQSTLYGSSCNRLKKMNKQENRKNSKKRQKIPLDMYNQLTRCLNCNSIYHEIRKCPDMSKRERSLLLDQLQENENGPVFEINHATPFIEDLSSSTSKMLSSQIRNSAVLDSGSPKNVCGKSWLHQYLSNLPKRERNNVIYWKSENKFKFGCGTIFSAYQSVKIPAKIGGNDYEIQTDIIEAEIPLLFGKEALNKTNATLDCKNDTLTIMGETIHLQETVSGHYILPLRANTLPRNNKETLSNENCPDMKFLYQDEMIMHDDKQKYKMKSSSLTRNKICFECGFSGHIRKDCIKLKKNTFQMQNKIGKGLYFKSTRPSCSRFLCYYNRESQFSRVNKYPNHYPRFRKPYAFHSYKGRNMYEFDCDIKCFVCEENGHIAKFCPNFVITCYKCSAKGHTARCCPNLIE